MIRGKQLLLAAAFLCSVQCSKNSGSFEIKADAVALAVVRDTVVSYDQMVKWLSCNPRLDSLSYIYNDSFKIENAQKRLGYQRNFTEAQDKICKEQGFEGGYGEYMKILKIASNPRNKHLLDSIKLTTF